MYKCLTAYIPRLAQYPHYVSLWLERVVILQHAFPRLTLLPRELLHSLSRRNYLRAYCYCSLQTRPAALHRAHLLAWRSTPPVARRSSAAAAAARPAETATIAAGPALVTAAPPSRPISGRAAGRGRGIGLSRRRRSSARGAHAAAAGAGALICRPPMRRNLQCGTSAKSEGW